MSRLIEVWGDTVDSRHMTGSILLGVGLATPVFLAAERIFAGFVDNETLGRSYALLAGLAACLTAGVLCARLVRPKRVVRIAEASEAGRRAALDEIAAEGGEWSDPDTLPEEVRAELKGLGLYDLLVAEHARRTTPSASDIDHAGTPREEEGARS